MKFLQFHRRRISGQTILPEHVLVYFLVIAAVAAMAVYMQRGLQARVRGARIYMVDLASKGCSDADKKGGLDCQGAAGVKNAGGINQEYEPYYGKSGTEVTRDQSQNNVLLEGGNGSTGIAGKTFAERTEITSVSGQLPPKDAQ